MKNLVLGLIMGLFVLSCQKKSKSQTVDDQPEQYSSSVKYAKGFDLLSYKGYKKLIIKAPYPEAEDQQEIILFDSLNPIESLKQGLQIPLSRVVVTSTTHVPMLEILREEDVLIGFPNTDYISSKKTRKRIEEGLVTDIGNAQDFNTEVLLSLRPEALIAFSMVSGSNMYQKIEKNGIPVIYNGDWLEETPLGRAEWIKFFGALLGKDQMADSIFNKIEESYLEAKNIALKAKLQPTIMSGVLYKDQWNLPAGESFTAQLYKDANTNYLWKESKGQGSLVLGLEAVLAKAENADFWIGSGYYTSLDELKQANAHYQKFNSYSKGSIYSFSSRRSENGGVEYFETGPLYPHIVLKDLIKVTHPELLQEYTPYYLQKLE